MDNKEITEMLLKLVCSINRADGCPEGSERWNVRRAKEQLEAILEYRYKEE